MGWNNLYQRYSSSPITKRIYLWMILVILVPTIILSAMIPPRFIQYDGGIIFLTGIALSGILIFLLKKFLLRLKGELKNFALSIVNDGEPSQECILPELNPLLEKVKERTDHLKMANEKITNIIASITDGFFTLDHQWRFTYLNKEAVRIWGRTDLIGKNIWEEFPHAVGTRFYTEYHIASSERVPVHFEALSPTLFKWVEVQAYPSRDGLLVYFRDISERKNSELEIMRLAAIVESSADAIIGKALDGTILTWNTGAEKIYGYEAQEVIGSPISVLIPPERHDEMLLILEKIMGGERVEHVETIRLSKDGKRIDVSISVSPITDAAGQIIGASTMARDISEHKRMVGEMARLDRLNLIAQMAAGIGHEIRNPMTTVRGYLQLMSLKKEFAEYNDHFDLMIEELDRANSIITEFLSMARSKPLELKTQNLNTIVEAILPLMTADAMLSNKYVRTELGDIPDLKLDAKEIRQLILNLARNGLEAMNAGSYLTIRTFISGDDVVLTVQDQGKGIEPAVLEKIGTPFFTTKESGTGLGLAVCYSIARGHNAKIEVETGEGGTSFIVRFLR